MLWHRWWPVPMSVVSSSSRPQDSSLRKVLTYFLPGVASISLWACLLFCFSCDLLFSIKNRKQTHKPWSGQFFFAFLLNHLQFHQNRRVFKEPYSRKFWFITNKFYICLFRKPMSPFSKMSEKSKQDFSLVSFYIEASNQKMTLREAVNLLFWWKRRDS